MDGYGRLRSEWVKHQRNDNKMYKTQVEPRAAGKRVFTGCKVDMYMYTCLEHLFPSKAALMLQYSQQDGW